MKKVFAFLTALLIVSSFGWSQTYERVNEPYRVKQVLSQSLYTNAAGDVGLGYLPLSDAGISQLQVPPQGFSEDQVYSQILYRKQGTVEGAVGVFLIGGGGGGVLPTSTTEHAPLTADNSGGWRENSGFLLNDSSPVRNIFESRGDKTFYFLSNKLASAVSPGYELVIADDLSPTDIALRLSEDNGLDPIITLYGVASPAQMVVHGDIDLDTTLGFTSTTSAGVMTSAFTATAPDDLIMGMGAPGPWLPPPSPVVLGSGKQNFIGSPVFNPATVIGPSVNALVLVAVNSVGPAGDPGIPVLTGAGMTWVQVATIYTGAGAGQSRSTLFRSMSATPGSGTLTYTFSTNVKSVCWSAVEYSNVDTSGTFGSGAIVQSTTLTDLFPPNTMTITLPGPLGSDGFMGVIFGANWVGSPGITAVDYTEVDNQWISGGLNNGMSTGYRADGVNSATANTVSSPRRTAIAVEIKGLGALPIQPFSRIAVDQVSPLRVKHLFEGSAFFQKGVDEDVMLMLGPPARSWSLGWTGAVAKISPYDTLDITYGAAPATTGDVLVRLSTTAGSVEVLRVLAGGGIYSVTGDGDWNIDNFGNLTTAGKASLDGVVRSDIVAQFGGWRHDSAAIINNSVSSMLQSQQGNSARETLSPPGDWWKGAEIQLVPGAGRRAFKVLDYSTSGGAILGLLNHFGAGDFIGTTAGSGFSLTEGVHFQCVSAGSNSACAANIEAAVDGLSNAEAELAGDWVGIFMARNTSSSALDNLQVGLNITSSIPAAIQAVEDGDEDAIVLALHGLEIRQLRHNPPDVSNDNSARFKYNVVTKKLQLSEDEGVYVDVVPTYTSSNVSNPPTDAELDALFGTPATVGDGFREIVDDTDSTNAYLCTSDGSKWFTFAGVDAL